VGREEEVREGVGGYAVVVRRYLWRRETWDARPPKEDAMVLNSTWRI
jgi:hypothetical protein